MTILINSIHSDRGDSKDCQLSADGSYGSERRNADGKLRLVLVWWEKVPVHVDDHGSI